MLAIVIPAYKITFFKEALTSLSNQTNKNFTVYIGDDCSPYNLKSVVDDFSYSLNIKYTRFSNNIGAKNLVHQWNRCVRLIKDEKWIWLFSDDDIADENCVQVFYETILADNSSFDVYRFNTRVINDSNNIIAETPESPYIDNVENMAFEILLGKRGNSMPDHIFCRRKYEEVKGFVFTDFAQAADWATSILFSYAKGIKTMKGAKVNWRKGDFNISGNVEKERNIKLRGYLQFLIWIHTFFKDKYRLKTENELRNAVYSNLQMILINHYKGLDKKSALDVFKFYYKLEKSFFLGFIKTIQLYKKIL